MAEALHAVGDSSVEMAKLQTPEPIPEAAPADATDSADANARDAEKNRRYLLAICRREHGEFESLEGGDLADVAALAVKPYAAPAEWRAVRFGPDGGGV